jgi:hypothetical protein
MKTYGTRRGQISHQIARIACYGSGEKRKQEIERMQRVAVSPR